MKFVLPRRLSGKESACQCRRLRRHGFDPQIRKVPWRRNWQPTLVFLPGKSYGQRSLAGYTVHGAPTCPKVGHDWATSLLHFFMTFGYLATLWTSERKGNLELVKGFDISNEIFPFPGTWGQGFNSEFCVSGVWIWNAGVWVGKMKSCWLAKVKKMRKWEDTEQTGVNLQ